MLNLNVKTRSGNLKKAKPNFNISAYTAWTVYFIEYSQYANGGQMLIIVSPWCISHWQVSWRSLAPAQLRSIFNQVSPLPDGPAIYGPERRRPGSVWQGQERRPRWQEGRGALSRMREPALEEWGEIRETLKVWRTAGPGRWSRGCCRCYIQIHLAFSKSYLWCLKYSNTSLQSPAIKICSSKNTNRATNTGKFPFAINDYNLYLKLLISTNFRSGTEIMSFFSQEGNRICKLRVAG